jgi:hypothetical protein
VEGSGGEALPEHLTEPPPPMTISGPGRGGENTAALLRWGNVGLLFCRYGVKLCL